MNQITTHVLDVSLGRPAPNVPVIVERQDAQGDWFEIGRGSTDVDGRVRDLAASAALCEGNYRLTFNTGAYFAARGIESLYPEIAIVFAVHKPQERYHIPLLLSPYGYSTYRGS